MLHPDFLGGLRGRAGRGRGGSQLLSVTRTQWERFTSMMADMGTSTMNVQVGHRGPAAMPTIEHAEDEVTIIDHLKIFVMGWENAHQYISVIKCTTIIH